MTAESYEARRDREKAEELTAARALGETRRALCLGLAEALTAATGDAWTLTGETWDSSDWRDWPAGDIARFDGASYARTRDGFAVCVGSMAWDRKPGRCRAWIKWPTPQGLTHGSNPRRAFRDSRAEANGRRLSAYDSPEPETAFDVSRSAKAVAGQIARVLILPDYAAAFAGFLQDDAETLAREAEARRWLDKVGQAAGAVASISQNDPGRVWWQDVKAPKQGGPDWCDIQDANPFRPGGSLRVKLPADPYAAAVMVSRIRAAFYQPAPGQAAAAPETRADWLGDDLDAAQRHELEQTRLTQESQE